MKMNRLIILFLACVICFGCQKTSPADNSETLPRYEEEDDDPSSEQKVYSVEEFRNTELGDRYVWVKGIIVGACSKSIKYAEWMDPFTYDNAILLADSLGDCTPEKVIAIQLRTKAMKAEFGLATTPDNYGRSVAFYGTKQKYLGVPGMKKNVAGGQWLDE